MKNCIETFSDNVHFQHSAQLMKAMVEADVYFRTLVGPLRLTAVGKSCFVGVWCLFFNLPKHTITIA